MEKRAIFSQVECTAGGQTGIRFEKLILDGERVEKREYHRAVLEPGTPLDSQLNAVIANLSAMGYPAPSDADIARIRAIVEADHTPERVAKFRKDKEDREEREKAIVKARGIV